MRKLLILLPVVALVAACSSAPKETYDRRAYEIEQKREQYAERAVDKAPKWMTELPKSNAAVYANGTAVSGDFSMADEKAKTIAFGKICMAAGGEVVEIKRLSEGSRFRSYVLIALPTGTANPMQQRRDQNRAQRSVQAQSDAAFRELDTRPKRQD